MTGTSQVTARAVSFFRGVQPTSPGAAKKKMLQIRPCDPANNQDELLPDEAQELKALLLSTPSHRQLWRFSFSKMRRVVLPPVQIPPELDAPNAVSNIVAGSRIPMTRAMWTKRRARMMQRLPGRIDERVAW